MRTYYAEGELEGDWAVFAKITRFFVHQVPAEDREDFLQDLLVKMAKVKEKYDAKGKTLTEAGLMWVGKYQLMGYWSKRIRRLFWLNCTNCTIEQRSECRSTTEYSQCPKGKRHQVLRLNEIIIDGDGGKPTEVQDRLASKSYDINARLDARRLLQSLPKRLIQIGYKIYAGFPLEKEEKEYLRHWRESNPTPSVWRRDRLDERILELLRKNPQGMTRSDLSRRLQVYVPGVSKHHQFNVQEVNWYLDQLIKKQQVIAVQRERATRGRQWTPLFFIAGAEIPEQKNVKEERDERIRQAFFTKGWSISRITRELHHDKRTIYRAIYGIQVKRR